MPQMTDAEYKQFMSEGTRTLKVATVRADGRPHVVPVWFILDGDDIIFTTGIDSAKGTDLLRDPRVAVCVDDERPPYSFVMVEGTATVLPAPPDMRLWATRIATRYMGPALAEAFGERNTTPEEALVRITPHKIIAQKDLAS